MEYGCKYAAQKYTYKILLAPLRTSLRRGDFAIFLPFRARFSGVFSELCLLSFSCDLTTLEEKEVTSSKRPLDWVYVVHSSLFWLAQIGVGERAVEVYREIMGHPLLWEYQKSPSSEVFGVNHGVRKMGNWHQGWWRRGGWRRRGWWEWGGWRGWRIGGRRVCGRLEVVFIMAVEELSGWSDFLFCEACHLQFDAVKGKMGSLERKTP